MVKCLNIGGNIGKPIYRSISSNKTKEGFPESPENIRSLAVLGKVTFKSDALQYCITFALLSHYFLNMSRA